MDCMAMTSHPPGRNMTTPELRHRVRDIIHTIEGACRRPLFEEVQLNQGVADQNLSLAEALVGIDHDAVIEDAANVGAGGPRNAGAGAKNSQGAGGGDSNKKRGPHGSVEEKETMTWTELLNEASKLLPYMTPKEHALASKLASILFLGYVLPNSTGNDMYLSRNYSQKRARRNVEAANLLQSGTSASVKISGQLAREDGANLSMDPLDIDLEELLENCTRVHAAQDYGEIDCISDDKVTASFHRFLRVGLGPFLACRPSHATETDLLHVLAMAVSPVVTLPGDRNEVPPSNDSSPIRARAERLMSCLHSHYFHVNYSDRAEIVNILANNYVPPEFGSSLVQQQPHQQQQGERKPDDQTSTNTDSPLFDGALPHLSCSLEAFAAGALTNQDVYKARRTLLNIAIYSSHETLVHKEMNALVSSLIEDCTDYRCSCRERHIGSKDHAVKLNEFDCPRAASGELLQDLILRYNGSRHYADGIFTRRALLLLSKGIALHMQNNVKEPHAQRDQAIAISACQFASLLDAARSLFYFLLPPKTIAVNDNHNDPDGQFADAEEDEDADVDGVADQEHQKEEGEAKDAVIKSAIRLLNHPEDLVVKAASKLLSLAFAYGGKDCTERHVKSTFVTIRSAFRRIITGSGSNMGNNSLQAVVTTISRQSPDFADAIVTFLVKQEAEQTDGECALYLISSIALSQPRVVVKHLDTLDKSYGNKGKCEGIQHLIAIHLSCRLAHYFASEEGVAKSSKRATALLEKVDDQWTMFRLARHAFCTANFGFTADIFSKHLTKRASSEYSHLWYASILKTARAEQIISRQGALGIPDALPLLQSATSHIHSLSSLSKRSINSPQDLSFQIQILNNRVDFLNLCVTMRGLCTEMRLSNSGASRGTRTQLHQRNTAHCFYALASRYAKLYRVYGMLHCQQTRTALRTLYALCRFMAIAATKIFSEAFHNRSRLHKFHENTETFWPKGDESHPISTVIRKFTDSIIHPMNESVDPMIRAAAFLEILDSVLKSPFPTPRGFFAAKPSPVAEMRMFANPSDVVCIRGTGQNDSAADSSEAEIVEVPPSVPCAVYATGKIPARYHSLSDLSFSQVIGWYKLTYDGPLLPDDEPFGEEQQGVDENEGSAFDDDGIYYSKEQETAEAPLSTPMQPGGKFVLPIVVDPINREGYYILQLKIGCRDIRCGEFEIPTMENAGVICLCITEQPMVDEQET